MRHETGEKVGETQLHVIQTDKHLPVAEVRAQSSEKKVYLFNIICVLSIKHDITKSNIVQTVMVLTRQSNKYHSIKNLKICVFSKEWLSSLCEIFTVWKASSRRYSLVWKYNSYQIPSVVKSWRMAWKSVKNRTFPSQHRINYRLINRKCNCEKELSCGKLAFLN